MMNSTSQRAGVKHTDRINVAGAIKFYIDKMMTTVPGFKTLLLDTETVTISSSVRSFRRRDCVIAEGYRGHELQSD